MAFDEFRLPNGLTVVGERMEGCRSLSVGLWVMSGSQYETRPENGVSHFLEHMLFKGTARRTARQIAEEMDAVGGQLNAFTAKDCTCFYAKVVDEDAPLAVDMLSDLALGSALDPAEMEKEKGVVLEEIAMVEDEPEDLVHELAMEAQFGDQPLSRNILGPAENVKGFTRAFISDYKERMYRPENSVLALSGGYDPQKIRDLAQAHFGAWMPGGGKKPQFHLEPAQPHVVRREKDIEQLHICLAYPGVAQGTEMVYPMSIFSSILGGAMSSRLFQRIREEKGMAYSVYSFPSFYSGAGSLAVYAGTSPENGAEVLRLIREETENLIRDGVTRQEFESTRGQLKGSYVLGMEGSSARMNALGRRKLIFGDIQSENDVIAKIDRVKYEDVQKVIRDCLTGRAACAMVGRGAGELDVSEIIG